MHAGPTLSVISDIAVLQIVDNIQAPKAKTIHFLFSGGGFNFFTMGLFLY